jgi:hypothetical protein
MRNRRTIRIAAALAGHAALALGAAAQAQQIGADDFRISAMGAVDTIYQAAQPAIAYNATEHEYLVVWTATDNDGATTGNEIYGQRIDAATGAEIGADDFRISAMSGPGVSPFDAFAPAVAWSSAANEYLVVWYGDTGAGGLIDEELEIFGQRLDAAGAEIGANDFRISAMGGTGNLTSTARHPGVAYDPVHDQFLVVWHANANPSGSIELEIFGQRLDGSGDPIGADDFRITDMGPPTNDSFDATLAEVAFNPDQLEFLVVWNADDNAGGMGVGEYEVFGQRIDAQTGSEIGFDDFRISDMGGSGTTSYAAQEMSLAYSETAHEYLVAWRGDDNVGGLINEEYEIFAQRLDGFGVEVGVNDFRVSEQGGTGSTVYGAYSPSVIGTLGGWAVAWSGSNATTGSYETFAQYLDIDGAEAGSAEVQVSDMGTGGHQANWPALAFSTSELLVVWSGLNQIPEGTEREIWGQRLVGAMPLFLDGFESGGISAWSDAVP